MRIALLSNFWYVRGGLERVMFADARGLEARGYVVAPFASAHALNEPNPFGDLFPPNVEHGALGVGLGVLERLRAAAHLFYNSEAVSAFDRFSVRFRPDLVHQHGLARQFSPAVLEHAHRRGIPTVLTLHDHGLRCPSGYLSRAGAPECIALSCTGHRYDRAVRFGCVHGSRVASGIAATELLVARALRRYERSVDLFLVPSTYLAERMSESGLPAGRLRVMPNAIDPRDGAEPGFVGSDVVAFGRLVAEKGFDLVVEVARALMDVRFVIAGEGPERSALVRRATGLTNVAFPGLVGEARQAELLSNALAVIVPSASPETFGMVVLEAWREGRAVIVTNRGALPEIVDDGRTGIVIAPGDVAAAASAIAGLAADPASAARLGAAGRREVETTYSMSCHLDRLEATYRELVS